MKSNGEFTLSHEDRFSAHYMAKGVSNDQWIIGIFGAVFAGVVFGASAYFTEIAMLAYIGVIIAALILFITFQERRRIKARSLPSSMIKFEISSEGFSLLSHEESVNHVWNEVQEVKIDGRGVLLIIENHQMYFIPQRAFSSGFDARALSDFFRTVMKKQHISRA